MRKPEAIISNSRDRMTQGVVLACLLLMGGVGLAGPSGLLAWGENSRLLEHRRAQIMALEAEQRELRNRVAMLDRDHADPDLVGELLRRNLNVVHPDEVVISVK